MSDSRHTLEADLLRHQEAGDLAAQARTLEALADLAYDDEDDGRPLAHGLYGQAWALYEQIGDQRSIAGIVLSLIALLPSVSWDEYTGTEVIFVDRARLYDMALTLYIKLDATREIADTYVAMGRSELHPPEVETYFLQQALTLFESLEDVPEQLSTLQSLMYRHAFNTPEYWLYVNKGLALYRASEDTAGELELLQRVYEYRHARPEVQPFVERAFFLHRQRNDIQSEARLFVSIGLDHARDKNHDTVRAMLEQALYLYMTHEDYVSALSVRNHISDVIVAADGYEAYLRYHHDTIETFRHIPINKYAVFRQLYETALDYDDHATAREGFQKAIIAAWDNLERQANLYWEWGTFEAYTMDQLHKGFMLCQWAVTLFDRCLPGQNQFHKKLRQIRREVNPSRYQYLQRRPS